MRAFSWRISIHGSGIVTHALLAWRVTAIEPILSGWREIRSLNAARVVDASFPVHERLDHPGYARYRALR